MSFRWVEYDSGDERMVRCHERDFCTQSEERFIPLGTREWMMKDGSGS